MPPEPRLDVLETHRVLRVARGGRLVPWLGPALRGLAGGRLKARACRHPVLDQVTRWRHCTGCPLRAGCAYGETVEGGGDGPDATRPVVVAPAYPCPEDGRVGDRVPVRVLFAGPVAAAHAAAFWEALRVGGADPGLGLGEDRVLFDVLPGAEPDRTEAVELPADPAAVPGAVPRVRVTLTGPLVLMTRAGGTERYLVERPTLAHLLRPWAALGRLFGGAVSDAAVRAVGDLAAGVRALGAEFRMVEFVKRSHRTGDRWEGRGVVGWGEYGPVPAGLLPWLRWAGRLHVGTHRVAGAGGFEVRTDEG
jgi:hypothetical protein